VRSLLALMLGLAAATAAADPTGRAIERALVGRDQQSAEFNAQLQGQPRGALEALHARQLQRLDTSTAPRLERSQMTRERDAQMLRLPPAASAPRPPERPLPLPGGLPGAVDPVPVQGGGG
jgi:hypothetical protein